jgi:SpoVK/Ycf46/Vps4 family AAA+-type ATPase
MLAKSAMEQGLPLIIVNTYYPGIADYINDIEQEVIILFDEFDKTFAKLDDINPQTEMLTLFDGISAGKKLFVITCNELRNLNDYLINRPGRFHYHFRFEYPKADEIKEYLEDKLNKEYYKEIDKVIAFSHKINLNYDCLRAIAFELNQGDSFEVVIQDLNILHINDEKYELIAYFKNGVVSHLKTYLDLFDEDEIRKEFEDEETGYDAFFLTFTPSDAIFDYTRGGNVISGKDIKIEVEKYLDSNDPKDKAIYDKYANTELDFLSIRHRKNKNLHYAV